MTDVVEPPDGSFVLARFRDHYMCGDVYHRDDREGHGDPEEAPQRWWWHDGNLWMSWNQIVARAGRAGLIIEPLGHREPTPCPTPPRVGR